jgi:hypothetical protein
MLAGQAVDEGPFDQRRANCGFVANLTAVRHRDLSAACGSSVQEAAGKGTSTSEVNR